MKKDSFVLICRVAWYGQSEIEINRACDDDNYYSTTDVGSSYLLYRCRCFQDKLDNYDSIWVEDYVWLFNYTFLNIEVCDGNWNHIQVGDKCLRLNWIVLEKFYESINIKSFDVFFNPQPNNLLLCSEKKICFVLKSSQNHLHKTMPCQARYDFSKHLIYPWSVFPCKTITIFWLSKDLRKKIHTCFQF